MRDIKRKAGLQIENKHNTRNMKAEVEWHTVKQEVKRKMLEIGILLC